ncbi:MAG TPA: tetratricopeptide repeat protein [Candidatus Polarisedimenticolaceae bacterium]
MIPTLAMLLAATVAAPAAPDAPPEPPSRPEAYSGAMIVFELKDATVVYPAGDGDDAERNRRSAVARARFLEVQHGVKTRVLADVDATPADLDANLLLLGWTNRVLGTSKAPRPFRRTDDGWTLFDGVTAAAGDDLLLFGINPYAGERVLLFWSRIDPESDRFMPWPRIGSDWAVVRGYRPIRQGMCAPGPLWPPVRDKRAEADHEVIDANLPPFAVVRTTPHVRIRSMPDLAGADLDAIAAAREQAINNAAKKLGVELPADFVVDLGVHKDEDAKRERTGVGDPAHSVPSRRELHMIRRLARSPSPHEEIHLLARARLGPCFSTALYEGLALDLEGVWRGQDLEVTVALLLASGRVAAPSDLLDEERLRRIGDTGGFATAGLFVRWLRATRPALFPKIYGLEEVSAATVGAVLDLSAADLDTAFRAWLEQTAARRSADVAFARAERDAQERLRAGDYAGAATALEHALAAKPEDPQTLFNLASARMRTNALDAAEAAFRRLLSLPLASGESRFRIFSHYQLGRIFDVQGRREEALAQYRRVLELPDEYDAHRLARERLESPATRSQLE